MSDDVNMLPPAGWYGDPQDQSMLRYWDGAQWTDQTRPMIDQPIAPEPQQAEPQPAAEPQTYPAQQGYTAPQGYAEPQPYAQQQPYVEQQGYAEQQSYVAEATAQPEPEAQPAEQSYAAEPEAGEAGGGAEEYSGPPIMIVTTNEVPGYRITAVLGEVFGLTVRARNAFSNMGASFRTMFGGEVKGYTQLLTDTRQEAVDRLKAEAAKLGASAVIGMRYDSGEIADLMNEVVAYGTAVVIEPE